MEDIRTMERETKALLDAKVPQLCRLNSPFLQLLIPHSHIFEQLQI